MKIGIAQINTTVGDFAGNKARILAAYHKAVAQGAALVVTPEMSVTGYPPRDLVHRSRFVPQNLETVESIAVEVGSVPLIVGCIELSDKGRGRPFRNAAAVLQNGKIICTRHKSLLPTYDVFDEDRYFEPADSLQTVELNGRCIGITICEDIWTDDYLPRPLYDVHPAHELVKHGAQIIINLSASPFHIGKPSMRERMLASEARDLNVPIVYCNAVGGNDQLVFDGNSLAIDETGGVVARLDGFKEDFAIADCGLRIADSSKQSSHYGTLSHPQSDAADLYRALVLGLRDYVHKCGFKSCVLGLSGGIDSALTAVIAAGALGAENVLGVSLPSVFSSQGSKDDARDLARNLGIHYDTVAIQAPVESVKAQLADLFAGRKEDITEENVQARMRGLILMSISNKMGHLLLTTGNKSELAVGYCTIYGDMCGGLAVISDVPKTRVYEVSRWINREREIIPWPSIEKPPSAELRPDQKDQDTLPEYEVLDGILELFVEQGKSASEIAAQGYDEAIVRWVLKRVDMNEWKRQQAAPGLRVTTKAFGMGRRIPIVQRFGE
jgi:NAD+ synthase (glutamine-hydrolysing)